MWALQSCHTELYEGGRPFVLPCQPVTGHGLWGWGESRTLGEAVFVSPGTSRKANNRGLSAGNTSSSHGNRSFPPEGERGSASGVHDCPPLPFSAASSL